MKWQPIETAPTDETVVDLWCGRDDERLANYYRVDYGSGNVFYAPMDSGRSCVRTATHWMTVEPPNDMETNESGDMILIDEIKPSLSALSEFYFPSNHLPRIDDHNLAVKKLRSLI